MRYLSMLLLSALAYSTAQPMLGGGTPALGGSPFGGAGLGGSPYGGFGGSPYGGLGGQQYGNNPLLGGMNAGLGMMEYIHTIMGYII